MDNVNWRKERDDAIEHLRKGERRPWEALLADGLPDLADADLREVRLRQADLTHAHMCGANLFGADLRGTNLSGATLVNVNLSRCCLAGADLTDADLTRTNLISANLSRAQLCRTILTDSRMGLTVLGDLDLRQTIGLESVQHAMWSHLSFDTLLRSRGDLSPKFLKGCGIPDQIIDYVTSLVHALGPIEFHSCFVSYSHVDEDFVWSLYRRLTAERLRVWFAPEDTKGGQKLHEQIFEAIHVHDRLLLVLSEGSMSSAWVRTEIARARRREVAECRRVLFPIRLVPFEAIRQWECFDADLGRDLAQEVREYFIPDFSNWQDPHAFDAAFARLLKDLRSDAK